MAATSRKVIAGQAFISALASAATPMVGAGYLGRCNGMSDAEMEITWDAAKAQANIAKHGVTFAQAATVLLDPLAMTVFDEAHSQSEERWFTLGTSSEGKLLAVAHTYRPAGPASSRCVSFRPGKRLVANGNNMKTETIDR